MSERPHFVGQLGDQLGAAEARVHRRLRRRRLMAGVMGGSVAGAGIFLGLDLASGDEPFQIVDARDSSTTAPAATSEPGPNGSLSSAISGVPVWSEASTLIGGESLPGAFWTGSEVIVMLTENGGNDVVGERWDPATNEVRQVAASGLSWRHAPAMVWTGDEVLVVGGSSGPGLNVVGAAYNPVDDEWRQIADPPGDLSGSDNAFGGPAVWTGDEMLIWRANLAYKPASNSWRSIAESPLSARARPATTWTGTELIVWGGCHAAGAQCDEENIGLLNDGARYDPVGDTWTPLPESPLAAGVHLVAGWTGSALLIFITDPGPGVGVTGAAFDPATDDWRSIAETPLSSRRFAASAWSGDQFVVWGGGSGTSLRDEHDGAAYDPVTNSWDLLPDAPGPGRSLHTMIFAGDRLYSTATRWAGAPLQLQLP